MEERCQWCKFRSAGPGGGCSQYTVSADKPVLPNPSSLCLGIKRGEGSKFEPAERFTKHGKLIIGYETDPSPGLGCIPSPTPEPDGEYSIVCREGRGAFKVDKDGNCFSDDSEMRPLGHISDFDEEEKITETTLDELLADIQKLREDLENGKR